ncbi:MAG TPA: hypothetical protein VNQ77_17440 [Frankiaceae bacterium]|nr:hypothetical protein [Frankiaceae bacterium]
MNAMTSDRPTPGRARLLHRLMALIARSDMGLEVFNETRADAKWGPDDTFWPADFVVVGADARIYVSALDGAAPAPDAVGVFEEARLVARALLDRLPDADAVAVVWLSSEDFDSILVTAYEAHDAVLGAQSQRLRAPIPIVECLRQYLAPVTPKWEDAAKTPAGDSLADVQSDIDMATATSAGQAVEGVAHRARTVRIDAKREGMNLSKRDAAWIARTLRKLQEGSIDVEELEAIIARQTPRGSRDD